jgi:hypothetical protein
MAASSKAAGGQGTGGMASRFKSLLNVVMYNRPKLLIGLNQNGTRQVNPFAVGVTRTKTPPAERGGLNHPWLYSRIC